MGSEFTFDVAGAESCLAWKVSDFDDYCRQLCWRQVRSEGRGGCFGRNLRHNISMSLWKIREQARSDWESDHGTRVERWPVAHPPAVLWIPFFANAACLGCTWIDRRTFGEGDLLQAGARARAHSVGAGCDPEQVDRLQIPISQHDGSIRPAVDLGFV